MINFHETIMGKKLIEVDVPKLIREIEKSNELKKAELELRHKENLLLERQVLALERANELAEQSI